MGRSRAIVCGSEAKSKISMTVIFSEVVVRSTDGSRSKGTLGMRWEKVKKREILLVGFLRSIYLGRCSVSEH